MNTQVKFITKRQMSKYLTLALKQRERALTKFTADYGPTSATVQELTQELAQLRSAINDLDLEDDKTPLEVAIDKKK